eukprot:TRINITY_DN2693_c1_g2_i1.p1 TRINITY_DN2693_c1_g2~~TRINITY_DN2693_c1_g2_i1.p1  ORF type:complete len:310 (-),score=80.96 TRINITY_DN2693_c1_g2_i1:149-952(-)
MALDGEGRNPLYWAAHGGHISTLEALASLAAPRWHANEESGSASDSQVKESNSRGEAMANYLAAALVSRGGDPQVKANELKEVHAAATAGHIEVIQWLADRRANLKSTALSSMMQPVHLAASSGATEAIKFLISRRVNVEEVARGSLLPIHLASLGGHAEVIDQLLALKASPHAKATDGSQPLHLASARGHVATVTSLLEARAKVNPSTRQKELPVHRAAEAGHMDILRLLEKHGANMDAKNGEGKTAHDMITPKSSRAADEDRSEL